MREDAPEEVCRQQEEDGQSDDLEYDAGHHHIVADGQSVRIAAARGGRFNATAARLKEERDDICGYEDPGVHLWSEQGQSRLDG